MKQENDIVFIVPPVRSFTQRFPLGLMYISSFLEMKGEKNSILDFKGISNNEAYEKIKANILELQPKFIGITCAVTELNIVKDMCDFIKKNTPNTIIILGGPHTTISPEDFVNLKIMFDYLVLGEGEITCYELIKALKIGLDINNVAGIAYVKEGKLVRNKPREMISNLDDLPFPAYDKVDMDYYCRPNMWAIRSVYISGFSIFSSRGCPYNCNFCASNTVWGKGIRFMSAERVAEYIEYIVQNFKVDAIYFIDESFTVSKERIYDIFNILNKKNIKIMFGCQTRVNLLDENLLRFLKKNGCIQIDLGIESGSDRMLKIMNKQTSKEMILKVGEICKKIKLRHYANMLINVPGETIEDIKDSLQMVKKMNYNVVIWNVYTPVPGVRWERKLDLEDFDAVLNFSNKKTSELLEKKYKFGNYQHTINDVLDCLYSSTFHPRYFKLQLNFYYYYSIYSFFNYIFDYRYILQLLKSKRKKEYILNLIRQNPNTQ